ncbi:hypothetical protein ANN_10433 [Periplaneta americana]|uniref:Uncharacterized protein n=1 Tax=Periplaneta americana TaxID=6978 RepID=A0ABQ8TQV8_PERAM|nr:hypothetical protein ANN_10433 [Periplaneta americana]
MAGLCEDGNEPPGSLKAKSKSISSPNTILMQEIPFFNSTAGVRALMWRLQLTMQTGIEYDVVVITEDVQNVHLLIEYRPHTDVSFTCEHDPKLQEYCVCPQNMPQFDSEAIPNQAPETNKPMILNGPTSKYREGSDQEVCVRLPPATGFEHASDRARGRRNADTGSIFMLKGRGGVLRQRDEGRVRAQLLRAE